MTLDGLRAAARHVDTIEEMLMAKYPLDQGQLNALWSYVGHKGEKRLPRNRGNKSKWRPKPDLLVSMPLRAFFAFRATLQTRHGRPFWTPCFNALTGIFAFRTRR